MRHLPGRARAGSAHHARRFRWHGRAALPHHRRRGRHLLTSGHSEADLHRLRADARAAWEAGLGAVLPETCVSRALAARPDLSLHASRTLVLAVGKAAAGMWRGAAPAMAGARAIVLLPEGYDSGELPAGTLLLRGGHPHPTAGSFESTRRILAEVDGLGAGDRLLVLLSGGTSALLEAPADGVTEEELAAAHQRLVASGLDIASINLARSRLSAVNGDI
ncbi:MAG: DUF4147 domain-containing protein, partial [Candidatus Binatia bacterium]